MLSLLGIRTEFAYIDKVDHVVHGICWISKLQSIFQGLVMCLTLFPKKLHYVDRFLFGLGSVFLLLTVFKLLDVD